MSTPSMSWLGIFKARPASGSSEESVAFPDAGEAVDQDGKKAAAEPFGAEADSMLGTGIATGSRDALADAYDRYGRNVFRFAFALTASCEAAEEITQEVFLFLVREWRRYDASRGPLEAWLIGVTRHLARKQMQRSPRAGFPSRDTALAETKTDERSAEGVADGRNDALEGLLTAERQQRLHAAIAMLPEAYREALVLHALRGMSYEAVSQELGFHETAVSSQPNSSLAPSLFPGLLGTVLPFAFLCALYWA
jgi:RNA polymerase sigma factor (sigma-70 family)